MSKTLHLFDAFGVEIEYMIVDRQTCRIKPVAELLLTNDQGEAENEVEHDSLAWSNELVQHVIELKTNGPAKKLAGLAAIFQEQLNDINRLLAPHDCMILPGATHPFMDPATETSIWERENTEIYQTFNAIFNCQGHGWSNLQSMHLNLPFAGDEEFFRLHNAIRLLLPFIPALSGASPFQDGRDTGYSDSRLVHYGKNCAKIPIVTGLIVPEPIRNRAEYEEKILAAIKKAIHPYDTKAVLQPKWTNARGAIARFDRGTIEIRVIDSQECPAADLAIAEIICSAVKSFTEVAGKQQEAMHLLTTEQLHHQLQQVIVTAEKATIEDPDIRRAFDLPQSVQTTGEFWQHYAERATDLSAAAKAALAVIFQQGTLATRMRKRVPEINLSSLRELCKNLAHCLATGTMLQN
jgi:carboxylate-amine ligase